MNRSILRNLNKWTQIEGKIIVAISGTGLFEDLESDVIFKLWNRIINCSTKEENLFTLQR